MTGVQILKIVFLILMVLLFSAFIVVGFIMKKDDKNSANSKNFRLLIRIRMGCFVAMLVLLLIVLLVS